eukprot:361808-Chlamydomonas_euryale.AAC.15
MYGMGRLKIAQSGMPFVTAPSPLRDPLCFAALNTGIPFVGPLPVTLAHHQSQKEIIGSNHQSQYVKPTGLEISAATKRMFRTQQTCGTAGCSRDST